MPIGILTGWQPADTLECSAHGLTRFYALQLWDKEDPPNRVFRTPASADAWLALQTLHLGARIAAIQAYSDKTACNFAGTMMWPFRLGLMNVAFSVRF